MADYTAVYGRPKAMTFTAGATITGGQVLYFSAADTVSPSATNCANYAGVAAHDAASGAPVTVLMGAGVVHETLAAATTSAGALVYAGAAGAVAAANSGYNVAIGVATRTTTTTTAVLRWKSLVG